LTRSEIVRRFGSMPWLVTQFRDLLMDARDSWSDTEFSKLYRLVRPYTMAGNARLRGLHGAVGHVVRHGIPGDLVECGTARGGSAALMALTLRELNERRLLWVFDTFEGLPAPTEEDPDFEIANQYTGSCRGALEDVRSLFERLSVLGESRLIKGLFQDTIPTCEVGAIAVCNRACCPAVI